jgi:hypothetical protein
MYYVGGPYGPQRLRTGNVNALMEECQYTLDMNMRKASDDADLNENDKNVPFTTLESV